MSKYKSKASKQFRSKLEEYCSFSLKEANLSFYYEPFQIVITEGFVYNPESWEKIGKQFELQRKKVNPIRYTPDFVSSPIIGDVVWIIETKGYFNPLARMKWKLFKLWLVSNGYNWKLYLPTNKKEVKECVEHIKSWTK